MPNWESVDMQSEAEKDLDRRLAQYYGPQLKEQPLAHASWTQLSSKLGPQRASRRQHLSRLSLYKLRRPANNFAPAYIIDAYERIAYDARVQSPIPMLRCRLKRGARIPSVQVSPFNKCPIKLLLPDNGQTVEQSELNVVLATGLARHLALSQMKYLFLKLLFALAVLLTLVGLYAGWIKNWLTLAIPIVIFIWILLAVSAYLLGRRLAFQSDVVVVSWLGRSNTCRGLHALADRSRTPYRDQWGEPSLAERIKRVCGTPVEVEDERLTLAR